MTTQLNTTELDFNKIKDNLKSYLKNSDTTFADYDFEGAGLNHLLDVLAYNTHYNAITAHTAVNESFIDTAQIRANVVSHAKLVGYTPRSASSASATLAIKLARTSGTDSSATIPSGTTFTTSVDGVNYTFQTLADTISDRYNDSTSNFEFDSVTIYEGSLKTAKFFFNNLQNEKFLLPTSDVDTSTLKITIKDSGSAVSSTTYNLFTTESDIGATSTIYYLQENYDGLFQIEFGNGVFGKKPNANSTIECSYLTCSKGEPNGAISFTYSGSLPTNTSLAGSGAITTVENASGGSDKESIESIQFNAPRSFVAQNRAVTAADYVVEVKKAVSDIQDVSVYGGQDVVPPQYGKVFIAIKPKSGLFLTLDQKTEILNHLNRKKIVTVIPEILDADYTYLFFNITSKYNSATTSLTRAQLESSIRESVINFDSTFLQNFSNNFRYSKFLKAIDDSNSSISGSAGQVYAYKRIKIAANDTAGQEITFGFKFLGDIQQAGSFISSSGWTYNRRTYFIDDAPILNDIEKRVLRRFYLNENNEKIIEDANVGFLYPLTGKLTINSQRVDSTSIIDITAIPFSYDIPGVENKLLTIDITKTILSADSNLNTASSGIVSESYVSAPPETNTSSANIFSASGVFVPHTMYDPVTGVAYFAATNAEHLAYATRGYVHYIPSTAAGVQVSSTTVGGTDSQTTSVGAAAAAPASYSSGTTSYSATETTTSTPSTSTTTTTTTYNTGSGPSY